eukprot:3273306-Alexandrium_andersonii.AAC.1
MDCHPGDRCGSPAKQPGTGQYTRDESQHLGRGAARSASPAAGLAWRLASRSGTPASTSIGGSGST